MARRKAWCPDRLDMIAVTEGPLPTEVLAAIEDAALKAQPKWPPYFSGV